MKLNAKIWPPGGWRFEEVATGCKFQSRSLMDLVEQVRAHREANNLGRETKALEDIQEQIMLRAPEEYDGWEE